MNPLAVVVRNSIMSSPPSPVSTSSPPVIAAHQAADHAQTVGRLPGSTHHPHNAGLLPGVSSCCCCVPVAADPDEKLNKGHPINIWRRHPVRCGLFFVFLSACIIYAVLFSNVCTLMSASWQRELPPPSPGPSSYAQTLTALENVIQMASSNMDMLTDKQKEQVEQARQMLDKLAPELRKKASQDLETKATTTTDTSNKRSQQPSKGKTTPDQAKSKEKEKAKAADTSKSKPPPPSKPNPALIAPSRSSILTAAGPSSSAILQSFRSSMTPFNPANIQCAKPTKKECDWSWGPPSSSSASTAVHTWDEVTVKDGMEEYKRPQDFYSYEIQRHMSPEGPGVIVRIFMRDQCCTSSSSSLPLSYFRLSTHGAAQAAVDPPLSLGGSASDLPAMGRGHQPVIPVAKGWGEDVQISAGNEKDVDGIQLSSSLRIVQRLLLLPDPGWYGVQVHLVHYNVSRDMVGETYPFHTKEYENRPGMFVYAPIKNVKDETITKVEIPLDVAKRGSAFISRQKFPLCGTSGDKVPPVESTPPSVPSLTSSLPLTGRWTFINPPPDSSNDFPHGLVSEQALDRYDTKWFVEHSEWRPYRCRLDENVPIHAALEKATWVHFVGDSITRHAFKQTCRTANGSIHSIDQTDPSIRRWDPPHLCIGPSHGSSYPDSETGMRTGWNPRWIITFTNWFWGKRQTLPSNANTVFDFMTECQEFRVQNTSGYFRGWPMCNEVVPQKLLDKMRDGPGLTWFAWGSHAAELGYDAKTLKLFLGTDAFKLGYFARNPTIFPLVTANSPQVIPAKFGHQALMRNNERVHASNTMMRQAIHATSKSYATYLQSNAGLDPVLDLYSPTHASHQVIKADAVHFNKWFNEHFSKWISHYIMHVPNFTRRKFATSQQSHSTTQTQKKPSASTPTPTPAPNQTSKQPSQAAKPSATPTNKKTDEKKPTTPSKQNNAKPTPPKATPKKEDKKDANKDNDKKNDKKDQSKK